MVDGMTGRGYTEEYARRIFKQLEGFGSYGFPESHAASFALLVYVSCWLKYYYPDVFCAALLNSQPMGFYQPAQIVGDARNHGVVVRPVDVNLSYWDNTLEEQDGKYRAVRLGFRQIKGIRQEDMELLVSGRVTPYKAIHHIRDAGVSQAALERLADADAFRSMGMDRRKAMWEATALSDRPMGIFTGHQSASDFEEPVSLPKLSLSEHVVQDYASIALSLKAHPVSFVRQQLTANFVTCNSDLSKFKDGMIIRVAGLVLVRQRPGTAGGVCFITIEDETGVANLVVFKSLFEKFRSEILTSRLLMVEGKLQIEGEVIHVVAKRCFNMSALLRGLNVSNDEDPDVSTLSRADERDEYASQAVNKKTQVRKKAVQLEIFPSGRNFR
ncbi:OB-fold nucleic acid binding domain-containing protein [Dyadobacter sp. 676]|uniref:Error-prone DNA polymerase n=1 Tax=Dyadobacter sp. 676 TaxID=3088362 RepID=A0AAU8FFR3_9BACT